MLAVIYLIIAIFFGTQLIRFLIPDIRRLYVGIAADQSILDKVPTSLFLNPGGYGDASACQYCGDVYLCVPGLPVLAEMFPQKLP